MITELTEFLVGFFFVALVGGATIFVIPLLIKADEYIKNRTKGGWSLGRVIFTIFMLIVLFYGSFKIGEYILNIIS